MSSLGIIQKAFKVTSRKLLYINVGMKALNATADSMGRSFRLRFEAKYVEIC